ncbi:MAG: hypothetical protein V8R08_06455 [Coriobacteriales bacterium]
MAMLGKTLVGFAIASASASYVVEIKAKNLIDNASEKLGSVAETITGAAAAAGGQVAKTAIDAVEGVAGTTTKLAENGKRFIYESSTEYKVKEAKKAGFEDGMNQGAYLVESNRRNYLCALAALGFYAARADGAICDEELKELHIDLLFIEKDEQIPSSTKIMLEELCKNESITFDDVVYWLDKLDLIVLQNMKLDIEEILQADEIITQQEEEVLQEFESYLHTRQKQDEESNKMMDLSCQMRQSLEEYESNMESVSAEFKAQTKLQDADIAFLTLATMLQVGRVFLVDYLDRVVLEREQAGSGNRLEKKLKKKQEEIFEKLESQEGAASPRELYAPLSQIIGTSGVPYDATSMTEGMPRLFKGANHRFSTLGHDPFFGYIFGTANILTNTITTTGSAAFGIAGIPSIGTYHVHYDALGRNPIISNQVPTAMMLGAVLERFTDCDYKSFIAAIIKQLIHMGTDAFTKLGLSLPGAQLVLDKRIIEKLTERIDYGDVLIFGGSATLTILINFLIATLHRWYLSSMNTDASISEELLEARTRKILMLSDTIATGTSAAKTLLTQGRSRFDIGGFATTAYRLFKDTRFITKLKYEYLNSSLNKIYQGRYVEIFGKEI